MDRKTSTEGGFSEINFLRNVVPQLSRLLVGKIGRENIWKKSHRPKEWPKRLTWKNPTTRRKDTLEELQAKLFQLRSMISVEKLSNPQKEMLKLYDENEFNELRIYHAFSSTLETLEKLKTDTFSSTSKSPQVNHIKLKLRDKLVEMLAPLQNAPPPPKRKCASKNYSPGAQPVSSKNNVNENLSAVGPSISACIPRGQVNGPIKSYRGAQTISYHDTPFQNLLQAPEPCRVSKPDCQHLMSLINHQQFSAETINQQFCTQINNQRFSTEISSQQFSTHTNSQQFSADTSGQQFSTDTSSQQFSTDTSGQQFSTDTSSQQFSTDTSSQQFSTDTSGQQFSTDTSSQQFSTGTCIQQLNKDPDIQKFMSDPEIQHLMSDPDIQHLLSDPDIQQLMSDPDIQQSMSDQDSQPFMSEQDIQQLMSDSDIQHLMSGPDIKQSLSDQDIQRFGIHAYNMQRKTEERDGHQTIPTQNHQTAISPVQDISIRQPSVEPKTEAPGSHQSCDSGIGSNNPTDNTVDDMHINSENFSRHDINVALDQIFSQLS